MSVLSGRRAQLTHPDRILWPQDGITKAELVSYLTAVADAMLPHLRDRPLSLTRFPRGIQSGGFYQKNAPPYTPAWITTYTFSHGDREVHYILCQDLATLQWLGNQAVIEIHSWLSRAPNPYVPDFAVIDLDPDPPAGFAEAVQAALLVKRVLDAFGLRGYPKTSGATGVHIYVPVEPRYTYATLAAFVGAVGDLLRESVPWLVTRERAVARRGGKLYVDHLQNVLGKTLVAPYSPRPLDGAPVSAPLRWEELPAVSPHMFTIRTMPARLAQVGDLFQEVLTDRQDIDAAVRQLGLHLQV